MVIANSPNEESRTNDLLIGNCQCADLMPNMASPIWVITNGFGSCRTDYGVCNIRKNYIDPRFSQTFESSFVSSIRTSRVYSWITFWLVVGVARPVEALESNINAESDLNA